LLKLHSAYIVYIIITIMETSIHIFFYQHQNEKWVTRLYYDIICAIENGIRAYSDFHLSRIYAQFPFQQFRNFIDLFLSRKSNQRNYCFENDVEYIDLWLQIFIISKFPEEIHFHIHSNYWESVTFRFYRTARSSIVYVQVGT